MCFLVKRRFYVVSIYLKLNIPKTFIIKEVMRTECIYMIYVILERPVKKPVLGQVFSLVAVMQL